MRDIDGNELKPGDVVRFVGSRVRADYIGKIDIVGGRYKLPVKDWDLVVLSVRMRQDFGCSPYSLVQLRKYGLALSTELRIVRKGVKHEPADVSFGQLLQNLTSV